MLYIMASFKKEITYLLDIVKIIDKKRFEKKIYYRCSLNNNEFYVVKTGLGKKSIPQNIDYFKDCDLLVSTGFCGALVKGIANGDIIVTNDIVSTINKDTYNFLIKGEKIDDGNLRSETINFDENLIDRFINELSKEGLNIRIGRCFTSPKIVRNRIQKTNLNKVTDAITVDMEDIYRFDLAKELGAEFLSIRAVLDEVSDDVPGFVDGFKMGQKLTGIISKMDRAGQSIAVAIEKFVNIWCQSPRCQSPR